MWGNRLGINARGALGPHSALASAFWALSPPEEARLPSATPLPATYSLELLLLLPAPSDPRSGSSHATHQGPKVTPTGLLGALPPSTALPGWLSGPLGLESPNFAVSGLRPAVSSPPCLHEVSGPRCSTSTLRASALQPPLQLPALLQRGLEALGAAGSAWPDAQGQGTAPHCAPGNSSRQT